MSMLIKIKKNMYKHLRDNISIISESLCIRVLYSLNVFCSIKFTVELLRTCSYIASRIRKNKVNKYWRKNEIKQYNVVKTRCFCMLLSIV